jgi:ubiquinone/menaquinone biosynthesis C-methylase UbiE
MIENIKIISAAEFLKKNKNKKPNQEEVWDNISDLWVEYKKKPFFTVEEFLNKASSDFEKLENSKFPKEKIRIIDLGCGSGRNMVKNDKIEYYGVDISSNQLKAAENTVKEKGINAKFFKISADKLPKDFKNEMFDYGLFIATLHCIEGEKGRENALKEFYRVLKKGSEGLISVWNSSDERFKDVNYHGDIYMSWRKDGKEHYRYYYLYNEEELINLLKGVGFDIIEIKTNLDVKDSMRITGSLKDRFSKKNLIVKVRK